MATGFVDSPDGASNGADARDLKIASRLQNLKVVFIPGRARTIGCLNTSEVKP